MLAAALRLSHYSGALVIMQCDVQSSVTVSSTPTALRQIALNTLQACFATVPDVESAVGQTV